MALSKGVSLGMEINQEYISAVELESEDKGVALQRYWKIELPSLLVTPSLSEENISDIQKFKEVINKLLDSASLRTRHISVAIPDASVKVSFLEVEDIPKERENIIELIKWNLKKAIPFPSHETVVDFQIIDIPSDESRLYRLLVALMKKGVLEQYENLFLDCRFLPDVIIPSFFAVYNLYHDFLLDAPVSALLALSKKRITVVMLKHGKPRFHRSKEIYDEKDAFREILASLNYYQDTYGEMPVRICLLGNGSEAAHLKGDIETYCGGIDIKPVDLSDVIKGVNGSMNILSGAAGAALKNSEQ